MNLSEASVNIIVKYKKNNLLIKDCNKHFSIPMPTQEVTLDE